MLQPPVSISGTEGIESNEAHGRFDWTVLGVLAVLLVGLALSFAVDSAVVRWVQDHAQGEWNQIARRVGLWGDWYGVMAVGVILWVTAQIWRNRRLQRLVLIMGLSSMLSGASANVIRAVTGRTRPLATASEGWYGARFGLGFKGGHHQFQSFPSAHTAVVAGFLAPMGLVAVFAHRCRRRAFGVLVFVGPSGLMAWARVWSGSHHLSDVVAACGLGLAIGAFLLRGDRLRRVEGCLGGAR